MAFCGLLPEYILASPSPQHSAARRGAHSQENFRLLPPSLPLPSLLASLLFPSSIRSTALKAIKRHGINISKAASSTITCSLSLLGLARSLAPPLYFSPIAMATVAPIVVFLAAGDNDIAVAVATSENELEVEGGREGR